MRRHLPVPAVALLTSVLLATAGCGGGEAADVPFTVHVSPEIFQGAIPGYPTNVLVTIADETPTDRPVTITALAEGADVSVSPSEIRAGEVAEVTLVAGDTAEERPLEIVVTGRRGALEATVTRSTKVMPLGEGPAAYAETLLGVFTAWLAEHHPELGIGTGTAFTGSFVCPVLVVTHYMFTNDEWEIGLAWHVMIAPDDWAEIYLRPRGQVAPAMAFHLSSQSAALDDGVVDVSEVTPPEEVVR